MITQVDARPEGRNGVAERPLAGIDHRYEQTVPRHLVHRHAIAEVLLTGWHATAPDEFLLTAQWPRSHSFYRPEAGLHDGCLMAETIRQSGLLLSHAGYGLAPGHAILMETMTHRLDREGLRMDACPAEFVLQISCTNVKRRGTTLAALTINAMIWRDDRLVGSGSGSCKCVTPAVYARLRGRDAGVPAGGRAKLPEPVLPALVGRRDPDDVVLSPIGEEGCWLLRTNRDHPVLFDHPVDHVPGMLLLEAARQAGRYLLPGGPSVVVEAGSEYLRFVELDAPTLIRAETTPAERDGSRTVRTTIEQHGEPAARINVRLSR